jgi:hypothetical protein
MAENNIGSIYTLVDIVKDSTLNITEFAAVLARKNPIVREAPMMEANQALTHIGSRQNSLPTVQKRALNDGVPKSTHKEVPVTAPMSLFETMSQVDEELLRLAGANAPQFRARKDSAFAEAMAQSVADEIFYGSIADDALGFNGLATLFNSSSVYPNGDSSWPYNVQLAGGSGSDGTSIYIVEWGMDKAHLIYPKGTVGGLEYQDLGRQLVSGITSTTEFVAYVSQFKWRCGLFVADQRCVQRIANIELSGADNIFDEDLLIKAIGNLPDEGENPNTRIYVNRTIKTQMRIKLKDKNNVHFTVENGLFGAKVLAFDQIPIQTSDAITTEATIS